MNKSLIIAAAIAVVALSSCTSTTTNNTAYTTTPETMVVNMTVADINVDEKPVTATTTWKWNPFRRVADYKKNAEAKVLRETSADVLVNPTYEVNSNGIFRGGSVTVTGHPGKYVNFRNLTEKDAEVINTLKGNLGVATPMVGTTAPSFIDRLRPKKQPKEPKLVDDNEWVNRHVAQILFGGGGGDQVTCDFSLGLMYEQYKKNWGWYGRLTLDFGENERGYKKTAFNVTGGAVKTLPKNFSLFAGTGVGACIDKGVVIPIDLGVQWNFKRFFISLSAQMAMSMYDFAQYTNYKVYGGIGYAF